MSDSTRHELSALVGSRICHDLISPLGAVGNGLELLNLTGKAPEGAPEMELIAQSVEHANARLRFFRIAFGAAREDQVIARNELASVLRENFNDGRIGLKADLPAEIPRRDAKLALLLILGLVNALPQGGTIRLAEAGGKWRLSGAGPQLRVDPAHWRKLDHPSPGTPLSAAEVQFALLPTAAAEAGRAPFVDLRDDKIEIAF
ncbi:MAG: histidine phosphotransferase family protein [Paracoccaceae bacterium]